MKTNKRFIASIAEIAVGIILFICNLAGIIDDYWSGMGTALIIVGVLQLIRQIKYRTNEAYREAVDVEVNDERNKSLSMKAWSWAGYWFVMIGAVASVVLKILGQDELVPVAAGSVCLVMVLYWLSYLHLKKKY